MFKNALNVSNFKTLAQIYERTQFVQLTNPMLPIRSFDAKNVMRLTPYDINIMWCTRVPPVDFTSDFTKNTQNTTPGAHE